METSAHVLLRGYPAWLFHVFLACYAVLSLAAIAACCGW